MGNEKPFGFYAELLSDFLDDCSFHPSLQISSPSTARDKAYALQRLKTEGLAFLHTRLSELSDALLVLLEEGNLPLIPSFKKVSGTPVPAFMQDYWLAICDREGHLLPEPDLYCIKVIYQVGRLFKKLELPYPKDVENSFVEKFKAVDASLHVRKDSYTREILSRASNVLSHILTGLSLTDISGKHGPGAVSTSEKQEQKWEFSRLYLALDEYYGFYDTFIGSDRMFLDRMNKYLTLQIETEATSKFVLVPKTATTPRGIVTQPLELMYVQQGQMIRIVEHLENHPITRGKVNFVSQTINQSLALESSYSGKSATVDLSDASDRLSLELIKQLFANHELLLAQMLASRATHVILPSGEKWKLKKFAAMGSALCFPIEALAFYCISVAAICAANPTVPWHNVTPHCYVYGDDIIVPGAHVSAVIDGLERVGLKVNSKKSYWSGRFRESCGVHAYAGIDITPVHIKRLPPVRGTDGQSIEAWISYAHAFEKLRYFRMAERIYSMIEHLLRAKLPYGPRDSGWICRLCDDTALAHILNQKWNIRMRWSKTYQRTEYHVPYLTVGYRDVQYADGWHRLQKGVLAPDQYGDPSKVVVPRSTKIKRGWRPL